MLAMFTDTGKIINQLCNCSHKKGEKNPLQEGEKSLSRSLNMALHLHLIDGYRVHQTMSLC